MKQRHRIFIQEYCQTFNASEAARRAGYKGRSDVIGARLLVNVSIKAEIARIVDGFRQAELPAMRQAAINLWQMVMQGGEGISMRDRLKASELLAKCSGLFTDRVEISTADGAKIQYITLPETARE